jgi:hypothetical protein
LHIEKCSSVSKIFCEKTCIRIFSLMSNARIKSLEELIREKRMKEELAALLTEQEKVCTAVSASCHSERKTLSLFCMNALSKVS